MNKYQLYTLGGALLAATSLSGAVQAAGSVGHFNSGAATNVFTAGALKISNTAFSTTAATANAQVIDGANVGANLGFLFTNSYNQGFNLNITIPVTGATFVGTPVARYLITGGSLATGSTIQTSMSAASLNPSLNPVVGALNNQIFISNVQISSANNTVGGGTAQSVSGVVLEGVAFTNAAGLATAGGSISLGATVASQANQNLVYETIASAPVVTSAAPLTTTVSAGTAASVAVGSGTTQFTAFTSGGLTVTLTSIAITSTGALATDLSTTVSADGSVAGTFAGSDGINVTVTSPALSDPAAVSLVVYSSAAGAPAVNSNLTAANFSAGSATFSLSNTAVTYAGSLAVQLTYSGTTAISAAAAGTVTLAYSIGTGSSVVAPASGSGVTTVVSRSGLNTQIDWANSGTGSGTGFTSYIRIHNTGSAAATASIVVKKDTTDGSAISTLGTYTTATVPAGGTIQVGVPTIESSLGITAPTGSYTLLISGAFPGYIQHLSYNGTSLIDLDGFRSAGATTP